MGLLGVQGAIVPGKKFQGVQASHDVNRQRSGSAFKQEHTTLHVRNLFNPQDTSVPGEFKSGQPS
jgi:hypothetical protein